MRKLLLFITINLLILSCTSTSKVQESNIDLEYYPSPNSKKNVAIIFLSGGEGGMPGYYYDFEAFTKAGYPCLALGYFKTKNTPRHPELIPLEYFYEAIKYFQSKPEVAGKKIVIYGTSLGGGFALKVASKYPEVRGVIASLPITLYLPAQNLSSNTLKSDTSFNGKPVPFLPFVPYDYSKLATQGVHELISLSMDNREAAEKALISAENINGPILLFSGEKDKVVPTTRMCTMLYNRLANNNFKFPYEHIIYKDADHRVTWDLKGETSIGNREARVDIDKRVFEFLDRL